MNVYALSDYHLALGVGDKPMDIFGDQWKDHWQKISSRWKEVVGDDDIVLSAGDTSWGMTIQEATPDLQAIDDLPGKKFIIRGNHDYWWSSYNKINNLGLKSITFIQNNAFKVEKYVICGTRGWTVCDENSSPDDRKIFERELIRLNLTLTDATKKKGDGDSIILLTHFPPFNAKFDDSPVTDIISRYCVSKVIYGHLHGKNIRQVESVVKSGAEYILTSCDFLDFKPLKIL